MKRLELFCATAMAALVANPAYAQEASPPPAEEAAEADPDEIFVTATLRSENLQAIPIAVSAYNAEALDKSGVKDLKNLDQVSASFNANSSQTESGGTTLRVTQNQVGDLRSFALDEAGLLVALWNETAEDQSVTPWYAISRDGGKSFAPVTATSYTIGTQHGGAFDPLQGLPDFFASSPLAGATSLYMVQYQTQALFEYQERVRAAGGNWFEAIRYAALPQVLPNFTTYTLWRLELNIRSAAIVGFVGAGGIGQELYQAISLNYYEDVSAIVLMVVATIMVIDLICEQLRHRLIGKENLQ